MKSVCPIVVAAGRLNKGCSIQEWLNAMAALSCIGIYSLRDWSIALEVSAHRADGTVYRERESILRGDDPLRAPSANECVQGPRHILSQWPAFADRQLPNAAGMENIGHIVAAERVVLDHAKPCKRWRTIELALGETENVFVIILAD